VDEFDDNKALEGSNFASCGGELGIHVAFRRKPNQERDEYKAASDTSFKFKFGFGENRVQRYSIPTTKANIGFIA